VVRLSLILFSREDQVHPVLKVIKKTAVLIFIIRSSLTKL
jgi:hypothetical protein